MSVSVFIDTNVFVYAHMANEAIKHKAALDLLNVRLIDERIFVSTQVLGEFYAAMVKYKREHKETAQFLNEIVEGANVLGVLLSTVERCLKLKETYGYSYWDSLILASALDNNCTVVYSEDMHHSQVIDGRLTIINPFVGLPENVK